MKIFKEFCFPFNSTGDYALMAAEFMFCLFIMYYIVEESLEIKIHGIAYFFTFWNILDLGVIGVRIVKIVRIFFLITATTVGIGLLDRSDNPMVKTCLITEWFVN